MCWFACLFVCLLFFEEAEGRELRVEGEWGTPEGNRNKSGTELQCIVVVAVG